MPQMTDLDVKQLSGIDPAWPIKTKQAFMRQHFGEDDSVPDAYELERERRQFEYEREMSDWLHGRTDVKPE